MRVKLLNSAMMPEPGKYELVKIGHFTFCSLLKEAYEKGILDSYIGYQQNIELIKRWTGIKLPISRETTRLESGDMLLIMKLKYRLVNPADKGKKEVKEEDFEFFICKYNSL